MNNKRQRNKLFTMLMLVMALLVPQWGWAQTATQPKEGDGTTENPYQITSAEELLWFSQHVGQNNASAKLMNNINLSSVCHAAGDGEEEISWDSFSYSYGGTFDGNGMTISNLYIKDDYFAGLFRYVSKGSCIKNLTIQNAEVITNSIYNPAGILAVEVSNSTIQNIKIDVKSSITASGSVVGGIVGNADDKSLINNCVNRAKVNGYSYVGGICGKGKISILGCSNYGKITGKSYCVGGICGRATGSTITDCANYVDIIGNETVGGIVGETSNSTFKNVFGYGNVQGNYTCGIVVGRSYKDSALGLLAYNSDATITMKGSQKEAIAIGYADDFTGQTKGYSKEVINNGIVTFLLQQKAAEGIVWGQDLTDTSKPYPVLGSVNKVYADGDVVYSCTGDFVSGTLTNALPYTEGMFKESHGNAITHDAVKAGCVIDGTQLYYECNACHKMFNDQQLAQEVSDVTDYAQGHDYYGESDICSKCNDEILEIKKGNTDIHIDKAIGEQTDIKSYKLFKYVASETGKLEVMTFSIYPIFPYTYGTLWDSKKSALLTSNFKDENTTNNGNFKITYNVEKDKTYYIGVRSSNGDALSGNYMLNVKFNGMDVDLPEGINGKGTAEEPFELKKAEHLKWFADYVNGENGNIYHPEACAKLTDNIDMISVCHAADNGQEEVSWTPIGNSDRIGWCGTFDGNNKVISNLYVSITYKNNRRYAGFFGSINGGCAKNVVFKNAEVIVDCENNNAGILAGMVSESTIQSIMTDTESVVYNNKSEYSDYTGGIVGNASNSDIKNCENHAKVNGYSRVGGICGYFWPASIVKCANHGMVSGKGIDVGGIVGQFDYGVIEDCANYAAIESSSDCVGGIAGYSNSNARFKNVFSKGNVTGVTSTSDDGEKVGFIVGYSYSSYGEELIAYGKESTLTINGKKVEARAVGYEKNGTSITEHSMAFINDEIKSGKVAYLLNSEMTDGTQAWYQKLGDNGDAYPVLKSTGDNTVYHGKKCDKITDVYTNDNSIFGEDGAIPHVFEIAGHPDANGLYGDVCINCNANNENVKYIQHFCGILGNNLKLTYDNGKYYAETVTLTDGEAYNSPVDIEVADFKYIRTFDAYKWQPLYVPFRMSLEQLTTNGLSVATPEDIQVVDETVTRLNVNKLKSGSSKANYPSLIMCESDGEKTIELADVTLAAAKEGFIDCWSMTRYYYFYGVYQANKNLASNSEDAINYIMKDGGLVLRNDDDVPAPQSWYMNVKIRQNPFGGGNEPLSSDAKAMPIYVIGEGYATGIENIDIEKEHTQQGIYDLQGRKLRQEPASGIYIKDGKKYVK